MTTSELTRTGRLQRVEQAVESFRRGDFVAGVTTMCEIVRPDWRMARFGDLGDLAVREGPALISVGDLAAYRHALAESAMPA